MTLRLIVQVAWRNLWRSPRRTLLTALAFAIGVFVLVGFIVLSDGFHGAMVDTAVRMASGHVTIKSAEGDSRQFSSREIQPASTDAIEEALGSQELAPYVEGTTPRLIVSALLNSAGGSGGVRLIGADPQREARLSLFSQKLTEGTFLEQAPLEQASLQANRKSPPILLGRLLADKLSLQIGSKLVLITQAGPEIQNGLFRVQGIFETGMSDADSRLAIVRLDHLQHLLGRPGAVSEFAVFLHRAGDARLVRGMLASVLDDNKKLSVLTWHESTAQLEQFMRIDDAGNILFSAIILCMVTLGVLNTALMAVLERRREFAIFAAAGMQPRWIGAMVATESLILTGLGTGFGFSAAMLAHRHFSMHGLDIGPLMTEDSVSAAGVVISSIVHSVMIPERIAEAGVFVCLLGLVAAIHPALRAAATEPAAGLTEQ